jgi:hypothetical protein
MIPPSIFKALGNSDAFIDLRRSSPFDFDFPAWTISSGAKRCVKSSNYEGLLCPPSVYSILFSWLVLKYSGCQCPRIILPGLEYEKRYLKVVGPKQYHSSPQFIFISIKMSQCIKTLFTSFLERPEQKYISLRGWENSMREKFMVAANITDRCPLWVYVHVVYKTSSALRLFLHVTLLKAGYEMGEERRDEWRPAYTIETIVAGIPLDSALKIIDSNGFRSGWSFSWDFRTGLINHPLGGIRA